MSRVFRALPLLALLTVLFSTAPATATIVVPMADQDLAAQADAIVLGRVARITSHWDPQRARIFTTIDVAVEEVLEGDVAEPEVTLTQQGGTIGGVKAWVRGNPEFHHGEKVLVYITQAPDGSLRTTHLFQGKFSVTVDPYTFDELAHRDPNPAGVHVLRVPGGTPAVDGWRLGELKDNIRAWAARKGQRKPLRTWPSVSADTLSATTSSFNFGTYPSRWFEADEGRSIPIVTDRRGEPSTPGGGFDEVRAALNVWSSVAGSSLELRDAGLSDALGYTYDGYNSISFRDPLSQIDPPVGCRGTLALGGYFHTLEQQVHGGRTFWRIVDADLTIADGWQGCGFYEIPANMAEVITHELGHVIGFDHSFNPAATMAAAAHFDGRGAWLHADDIEGLLYSYPASTQTLTLWVGRDGNAAGTVRSTPSGVSCGTDCTHTFAHGVTVTLTAIAPLGSAFTGWSGACSGSGACVVTMTANTTVTATFMAARADLRVAAVSEPPESAVPGARFTATDTVTNGGDTGATSSRTRYYLSTSGTRGASDILLGGSRLVSTLAVGAQSAGSVAVTVPSTAAAGTYRLVACADDTVAVAESDETNNCRASVRSIVIGLPDLVTAAVSNPPASARRGTGFAVNDTVRNQGDATAAASTTRYYLSRDATRDTADRMMMGTRPVATLAPGATSAGTVNVAIPSTLMPGTYFVLACADDLSRVKEAGGTNNCRASATAVSVTP